MANAQTKSLKLYFLHTGEKAEIVFKRGGRFDQAGLKKINWFLRDWRRNEPTKMDPNLLDLVWEAYRQTGSREYIHVISAYRSSASNELLRKRGRGVARTSQHTLGKALDFFIPGVKLSKLREIGLKLGVGGVGYYPKSGSPFVHFDTGRVRHWPRMSRKELARVFPDGKTMHVPTDGKPLARYEAAVAEFKRKSASGNLIPNARGGAGNGGLNFFQRLAQQAREDEEDDNDSVTTPVPRQVATSRREAPKPAEPTQPEEPAAPQFAALPSRVPVPTLAPRAAIAADGVPVTPVIAAEQETRETAPELAPDGPDAIADEAPLDETAPQDGTIALASANIPVPARRPEFEIDTNTDLNAGQALAALDEAVSAAQEPGAQVDAQPETQLAMLPPQTAPTVAARPAVNELTPDEIEELRRIVRQQIDDTAPRVARAPIPAAEIGNGTSPSIASEENQPSALQVASIPQAEGVSVPAQSPRAAIEQNEAVAIEQGEQTQPQARIELASLPVPKPAPRVASQARGTGIPLNAENTQITARPVSLDALSAPQDNTSTIGKWALAADTTIEQLADVQPPAYGRNLIRITSNTDIAQKFALQPFGPGRNSFNGKAVRDVRNNRGS